MESFIIIITDYDVNYFSNEFSVAFLFSIILLTLFKIKLVLCLFSPSCPLC